MLYTNALLIKLMTGVHNEIKTDLYKQRISESMTWVLRDIKNGNDTGFVFADALDTDGEGVEVKFCVWSET